MQMLRAQQGMLLLDPSVCSLDCQSGAVLRSMFEINISASDWGRGFDRFPVKPIPHVIERATLSDSVGFLRGLRFPPTCIINRPILSIEPIMSLLTLSSQFNIYFFFSFNNRLRCQTPIAMQICMINHCNHGHVAREVMVTSRKKVQIGLFRRIHTG
jgi:hypothetical protein